MVESTTRLTDRSATTIDLCFTNIKTIVRTTIEDQISDHRNIEVEFKYTVKSKNNDRKIIRIWKDYSQRAWLDEIKKQKQIGC